MVILGPYKDQIIHAEEILLGKRPMLLILFVAILDGLLIFSYITGMGVFAFLTFSCLIIFAIYFLNFKFGVLNLVPEVDAIKNKDSDKNMKSFEEICSFLATLKQNLSKIFDYLLGNQFEHGVSKCLYILAVWCTLAFVFNIIGKFWLFFITVNIIILTPGFNILYVLFKWMVSIAQAIFSMALASQQPQQPQQQGYQQQPQNSNPNPSTQEETPSLRITNVLERGVSDPQNDDDAHEEQEEVPQVTEDAPHENE